MWETACQDIRSWIDQGFSPVAVSVNVSRADIYNPNLIHILMNLIKKYDIPIRYLHLEITESAYTENPQQIIATVSRLRKLGFAIEMDDFGSGYSSLNMLEEMPVDVLKLDMGFIQSETRAASGKGIISFVISLAKWLNLAVVAEGVETKEQIVTLRSMDCNYVQGFYYAKPMDRDSFEALIRTNQTTEMVCTSQTAAQYISEKRKGDGISRGRVMLIVDDIEVNRVAIASNFMDEYVVVEQENGRDAWEYLGENYDRVDIVMLDLLMPVMDGFTLLGKIRQDERMAHLPVIITSQGDEDSEHRALEMQADDFISKPYNADIIRHRVANVMAGFQLRKLRDDLQQEEIEDINEAVDSLDADEILMMTDKRIVRNIRGLRNHFDVVRLVDPQRMIVYEAGDVKQCDMHSCFSQWGKSNRCSNCTSLRAYEGKTRCTKLEKTKDGQQYLVISQYVPYGRLGAVLEMVAKLD